MQLETAFNIGDEVLIPAIEARGHVEAIVVEVIGVMYRVIYWMGGKREAVSLYPWEIQAVGSKTKGNQDGD